MAHIVEPEPSPDRHHAPTRKVSAMSNPSKPPERYTRAQVQRMVDKAVREATKPIQAQIDAAKEELAEVHATYKGEVQKAARPRTTKAATKSPDVSHFEHLADNTTDPLLARGYRELAAREAETPTRKP